MVLSYNPLDSYDWVLLTLVAADLISHQTSRYISQTFLITGAIILLFASILAVMFQMFRSHFRYVERIAFVDSVTGEMNNAAFQVACSDLLQAAPPNTYTVVLLNLKNFKLINEEFGTSQGDDILRHIMRVLTRHIADGELATRAHADSFFLCLKEKDAAVIQQRLHEIILDINAFNQNRQEPYYLTVQQGAYTVDDPKLEVTIIQDRATTACRTRSAVEDGFCIFYDIAFTKRLQKEQELNGLFGKSLQNGDFQVFLQPKVWAASGRTGGAEALVRWIHPQRGMIYPSDFIPLFEKSGKICRLDLYIFEEVCRTLRRWLDTGAEPFSISVNLSRQHFRSADCLIPFYKIAQKYRSPPKTIELELTESIFFDDSSIQNIKLQIQKMHAMGFLCSLDDFGMGYSSLGLLMEFDVDVIKLDRGFFLNIQQVKARKTIASILNLARELGACTVAEGIETSEQVEFLQKVNCDLIQGYFYSKPLPIPEFEKWTQNQLKHPLLP